MPRWKMQERADSVHVFPLADERRHRTMTLEGGKICECKPVVDYGYPKPVVEHNSFDFREFTEEVIA